MAGLTVDDVIGNKQAVTMLMHYHAQFEDENVALRNDLNTLKVYVEQYEKKRNDAMISGGLQFLATLFIGFGINILTGDGKPAPGWLLMVAGVLTQIFGLYLALRGPEAKR